MKLVALDRTGIGKDLSRARERLRLSLTDVAEASGVAASHVWNLENGRKDVSLQRFASVCGALGLPVADVISDNLMADRVFLFERAVEVQKISDKWSKERVALALVVTDYTTAISTIICTALLTGRFSIQDWTIPAQGIKDALSVVFLRMNVEQTIDQRRDQLQQFVDDPVGALRRIGLLTDQLIAEFAETAGGSKRLEGKYAYWQPATHKQTERLFSSGSDHLEAFDPQALGAMFRELSEAVADDSIASASRRLKRKAKKEG